MTEKTTFDPVRFLWDQVKHLLLQQRGHSAAASQGYNDLVKLEKAGLFQGTGKDNTTTLAFDVEPILLKYREEFEHSMALLKKELIDYIDAKLIEPAVEIEPVVESTAPPPEPLPEPIENETLPEPPKVEDMNEDNIDELLEKYKSELAESPSPDENPE